ncbi:MAG: hypothetical protein A3E83_08675 [Gammaproteobacteria bacterium RIFCSPHIGHO2_12_FULL_41_20]|nr:MAG: hypothetical protein A3E83_08675 [Gammaproteobacteria bacterium RIFCSPHIGHO2_12_FULL_41_20]
MQPRFFSSSPSATDKNQHFSQEECINYLREYLPCHAITRDDIQQWQPSSEGASLSKVHCDAIIFLVLDKKLSFTQALQEVNKLNKHQANLLDTLYERGLRGADLRAWQPPVEERHGPPHFSKVYSDAVLTLVLDRELTPQQALHRLNGLESDEVQRHVLSGRRRMVLR